MSIEVTLHHRACVNFIRISDLRNHFFRLGAYNETASLTFQTGRVPAPSPQWQ